MLLILFSVVTIGVWIVVEVTQRFLSTETTLDYQTYLKPINPDFDEISLQEINTRERENALIERNALD